ncbi:MAG: hypothetical protein Q7U10_07395 [Thermodesulfovibrionia bacterium]|nr:hypothetical protein [Thermodesulfovibrionia bacterium]
MSITAIMLFFFCVLVWTFTYGPAKRSFIIPDKTVAVKSAEDIDSIWHSSGVHGRVAVLFTRHLNRQFSGIAIPETDYLDRAMRHGIVRTAYHIVPDIFWSEVVLEIMARQELIVPLIATDTGYIFLHEGGRVHVMPLSKYIPGQEKALVVIEPGVWTQKEDSRIDGFIKSGQLSTDLVLIINGK